MAATHGYKCEFIEQVSAECYCGVCRHVAWRPSLASCCGEHFCQSCIVSFLEGKKPCPSCNEAEFLVMLNKKVQHKVLALEVCCTMKDRGCGWTGKLECLDTHLDIYTGNCQHIDVECSNKCGELVQKCILSNHLANNCAKRWYSCKYCGFKSTFDAVTNEHWSMCPHYPVQCPNVCSVITIERCDLEYHLERCTMQEVDCEFKYAGCDETFLRQDLEEHMKDNTANHLSLMSATNLRLSRESEEKLQEQRKEFQGYMEQQKREGAEQLQRRCEELERKFATELDKFQQELQEKHEEQLQQKEKYDRDIEVKIKQLQAQLQEKGQDIEELKRLNGPPYQFTVGNFNQLKTSDKWWYSPPMYTHPCGYQFFIEVYPNGIGGGHRTHVSVRLNSLRGEFDSQLTWPVSFMITLQLLNQHRDKDHIKVVTQCGWSKGVMTSAPLSFKLVAYKDLQWNREKQTQYLKNDCLHFRVVKIEYPLL